jgi:tetratricopeptide (TPR) repeat protein
LETRLPTVPARNPLFSGRSDDLARVASALAASRTVVICGPDGIGKTQLAAEYVRMHAPDFPDGVVWLSFSTPDNVPIRVAAQGAAAAAELRPDFADLSLDDQVHAVLRTWQSETARLLVFDDCNADDLLREWLPSSGGASVLVTSRRAEWDSSLRAAVVPLGPLQQEDSVDLLRRLRPDVAAASPSLQRLAEELEDQPLPLRLAGGLMVWGGEISVEAFVDQLRARALLDHAAALVAEEEVLQPTGLLARWRSPKPPPTARTFALAVRWLERADSGRAALTVLARAACFAAGELVPAELLIKAVQGGASEGGQEGIAWLAQLGLVEWDEGLVRLHPVIADMARASLPHSGPEVAAEESAMEWARAAGEGADPVMRTTTIAHLDFMAGLTLSHSEDERAAALGFELGRWLWAAGDLRRARASLERTLEIRERRLEPDDQRILMTLTSLGSVMEEQRDLDGAQETLERALALAERTLGREHPDTAKILTSLARTMRHQGDLASARTLLERGLRASEDLLVSDHPDTIARLEGLAVLLREYGDTGAARAYGERALNVLERTLGSQHPRTLAAVNNMGMLLRDEGDLAGARTYFEYALRTCEETLGPDHPETATALDNMGTLLHSEGDLEGARKLIERGLAIRERTLGPDSAASGASYNNLGRLLRDQGDLEGARPCFEQALVVSQRTLGPYDPQTASSYSNLGTLLLGLGDPYNAQADLERALAIREQGLGADHPETATSLANVGALHVAFGDLSVARTYLERALEVREEVLGPEHPLTATSLHALGRVLRDLGDVQAAIRRLEQAVEIRERILGPDHPDTLASMNDLDQLTRQTGGRTSAWPRPPLPDTPFFEPDDDE